MVDVLKSPAKREAIKTWTDSVVDLYLKKREQYGDSFSTSAEAFKYPGERDDHAAVRLFLQREYDKLKRIHSGISNPTTDLLEPGGPVQEAFQDIVGYVLVIRSYLQEQAEKNF